MSDKIRIFALGGLDEDGKNCTIVEINGDIFVVDCGVRFPDRTMPGIDYIIPNCDYLFENKDRIKAYLLTHGHDDQTGALAFIYEQCPAPIYGSKVTLTMLSMFTRHVGRDPKMYDLHPVEPSSVLKIAGRRVVFFHTAHNIADSSGIAISTSYGNIVFTGDYVVENAALPAYLHDMNMIAKLAEETTLVLLSDSVFSDRAGYTAPSYKLTPLVEEIFKDAIGRIYVTVFSTNFYLIDEIIRLAVANRKKIICYDEETLELIQTMQSSGQLMIPRQNYAPIDDILRLRDQDIVVLMAGFGSKLYSKIALLAANDQEDQRFKLKPNDTVIVASPANSNTEIEATDAIDTLFRSGAHVREIKKKELVNMHASEEDLKMMASILKPKYYVPVKGFYKDLLHNGLLALSMGINLNHTNTFVLEGNGVSLLFDENGGRIFNENIPHGDLMIDGKGVGDIGENVIADREKLAEGVVVLALTISKSTRSIVAGPDVQMRGFVFVRDADMILRDVSKIFVSTVQDFLDGRYAYNIDEIKQNVYEKCLRAIRRQTGREPMVLPLIVEIP